MSKKIRQILFGTIAVVGTYLICFAVILVAAAFSRFWPMQIPRTAIPTFLLIVLGVPSLVSFQVARRLSRRWSHADSTGASRHQLPGKLAAILVAAYIVTGIFGSPAVQSRSTSWAVSEYKRVKASGSSRVWESHPYIATYVAIPVLPMVILSYDEYQLDGLYGLGSFGLSVWYGVGVKTLARLPLWIS